MSTPSTKMITIKSSEGEIFEVEESVVALSQTIKLLIEDNCANNVIPLPDMSAMTFSKVMEYCRMHVESAAAADSSPENKKSAEKTLKDWDSDFIEIDQHTLYGLIQAAKYLDIPGLLDLCYNRALDIIRKKSPEEIREIFNIKND